MSHETVTHDLGLAVWCGTYLTDTLIYTNERGWMAWNGTHWVCDSKARIVTAEVAALLRNKSDAYAGHNDDIAKACRPSDGRVRAVTNQLSALLASHQPYATEFTTAPHQINFENGVVDLIDGSVHPHDPQMRHTTICTCPLVPGSESDLWENALIDWFPDGELRRYVHILMGYAITGEANLDIFAWFKGPPRSGKGTFLQSIAAVLGYDYSTEIDTSDLLQQNGARPWALMNALSARLVLADETEQSKRAYLNANLLKKITGGGRQVIERKYETPYAAPTPTTLCVMSNSMPQTLTADQAFWDSRITIIPFGDGITSRIGREDFNLRSQLREKQHQTAIAAWLVRGAMTYYRLNRQLPAKPQIVVSAIAESKTYSDQIGNWLSDRTVASTDGYAWMSNLFADYTDWCSESGEIAEAPEMRLLRKRITDRGHRVLRTSAGGRNDYKVFGLVLLSTAGRANPPRPWESEAEADENLAKRYAPASMGFDSTGAFVGAPNGK
jgi:putative DNA primase/helicase